MCNCFVVQAKGETIGPFGASTIGDPFDDGAFDGVRAVTIYTDKIGVTGITVRYVANDQFHIRNHGNGNSLCEQFDFEVEYPVEFITAISGSHGVDTKLNTSFVSSLQFVTSHGRTSELFGDSSTFSTPFVLESHGGQAERVVGFLGASGDRINTLGAHFGYPTRTSTRNVPILEIVLPPIVSVGLSSFDDGVKKVTVKGNNTGISYLKIEYVQDDKFEEREHGSDKKDQHEVDFEIDFEIEYPQEYITAMVISWSVLSTEPQVMAIAILTSYSRWGMLGLEGNNCKNYTLKPKAGLGPKMVGFTGGANSTINYIGARFVPKSSNAKTEFSPSLFLVMFGYVVVVVGVM
ncbi:hypothetical protein AALP_AA8G458000 [Arabis alpina]|uniref:Jacalin-type lectin domain-containing protein n=1 Tax=Arabis alpina TaxID=50452 RepID=A0A087GDP3_ARAAL|nr:hypothetical protein AALP_AA8G458000 [Arabis alpina]